jgi:predicted DNA-binding transcriptional regulator AlpA
MPEAQIILTQLTAEEIRHLFRDEIERFFGTADSRTKPDVDETGKGAAFASRITGKAIPTIYSLVHQRLIPHSKRGGDLYFSRSELEEWIRSGRRKTRAEIISTVA